MSDTMNTLAAAIEAVIQEHVQQILGEIERVSYRQDELDGKLDELRGSLLKRTQAEARLTEDIDTLKKETFKPAGEIEPFQIGEKFQQAARQICEEKPRNMRWDNGIEWEWKQRLHGGDAGDEWSLLVHSAHMGPDHRHPGVFQIQMTGKVIGKVSGYGCQRVIEVEAVTPGGNAIRKIKCRTFFVTQNKDWTLARVKDGPDFIVASIEDQAARRNWS